ncbi:MAG: transcription termination/antitermination protein NusG [Acidobacteriota bacterium]
MNEAGHQPESTGKEWFIVHTYSGFEAKVKRSLLERAEVQGLQEKVGEVLIPIENVMEMRGGKKLVTSKKFYPGYIFVELLWDTDVYYLVKQTPKVTGFVGISTDSRGVPQKPPVVSREEVERIVNHVEESKEEPKPKFTFDKGETVRITEGPFASFQGKVEEINEDKNTLKVMVTIFGRATPVELDFLQVEKL